MSKGKPRVAVHKFTSCDGCQLAFLNLGPQLLELAQLVDIVHFAEAGMVAPDAEVDIAFVEGSISTPHEAERIRAIRAASKQVITIGACATAGGIQALRNLHNASEWMADVYARPDHLETLATSTPVSEHIRVDLELWGCPTNGRQVIGAVRSLLFGAAPVDERDKICVECKRKQNVCVLVAKGEPCMGPVTRTGCGALCPAVERDCFACYGPSDNPNTGALAHRFRELGLSERAVADRFLFINNWAQAYRVEGLKWREQENG